jgi:hypothetical protein
VPVSRIRQASISNLSPFKRLLTRRLSDIKEQVAAFFGKEPLVVAAKRSGVGQITSVKDAWATKI